MVNIETLRAEVLAGAFAAHPERFKGRMPQAAELPTAAWINKPCQTIDASLN